jgi:mRNA-degrading endonuclease toxin of MazEF toxin-antitoxin module
MPNELKNGKWVKDFDDWNTHKKSLNKRRKIPRFSEREIWYMAVGTNIGSEVDGKNNDYERPVLVLKKYTNTIFLGLPMTSTRYRGSWYYKIKTEKNSVVILNQSKTFSSKRLIRRIYRLNEAEFAVAKRLYQDSLK